MAGEGEIIGDVAQAAMATRAAEPDRGEDKRCLNCGTVLIGKHCHACGQAAVVHRTLGAFFHDLLHGVLHFEGKIWRTLPLLAWNPGRLTRGYIDGRRANYVSPIALFLFTVFLTFAVFNQLGARTDWSAVNVNDARIGLGQTERDLTSEIAKLERELAESKSAGHADSGLADRLSDKRAELAGIKDFKAGRMPETIVKSETPGNEDLVERINAVWSKIRQNPQLAIYKLQYSAYKFSWLLIPISLPFLWLLFPFSRRFGLYDHLVFTTYSISFMMILLMIGTLADQSAWTSWIAALAPFYLPVHLYRQMRVTYALSRKGALLRLPVLLTFAAAALLVWGMALLALVIRG